MSDVLWKLDGVSLGAGPAPRLRDVTVTLRTGVTAVLGCSGAGKTSLLNLLVGFESPDAGSVAATLPAGARGPAVYWVPQNGGLWPHLTVLEHLEAVMPPPVGRGEALDLLRALDVAGRAEARPHELSQGERSRVAVARALAAEAGVLVMDEPFASVDAARVGRYWAVVRARVASSGGSLVFATHAAEAVLGEAERVVCLTEGRVLYEGEVAELYWRPRSRAEADCLGPGNWLSAEEARLWLGREEGGPRCFRPEQLGVAEADGAPLVVQSSRFKGSAAEVELTHEGTGATRRFVHRPVSDGLARGTRVVLRVLAGLVLAVLLGCRGGDGPTLAVSRVDYWPMPPDGTTLPAPRVVAILRNDDVLAIDDAGRVLVFNDRGEVVRQWRMPDSSIGHPEGACLLADGRIAVADTHYHRVVLFDDAGRVAGTFGSRGTGPGEFLFPVAVAQDDKGVLYVAEYGGNDRVQTFTPSGRVLGSFGSAGTGREQFQRPAGLVWHAGKVYVADAINNRVQVFADDGRFVGTLGRGERPLSFHFPYDISIGADDALVVVEFGAGRVSKVSLSGALLGRFGRRGKGEGQFDTPWGVAVDSKLRIRVADTRNRRIVGLSP